MATIHHSIVKLGAKQGVVLTLDDDAILALHAETNSRCYASIEDPDEATAINDAAREALATCADMAEWKRNPAHEGWKVEQTEDGEWAGQHGKAGETRFDEESWDDLKAAIDEALEAEADAFDEEDEDEEGTSSVVPERFKLLYAEVGVNGQDNGDFLAREMHIRCTKLVGKATRTDVDKVALLAWANGLEREPIEGNRGWEGRYRMTVANMLRKIIADRGHLNLGALREAGEPQALDVPEAFRLKWASKSRKKELEADVG